MGFKVGDKVRCVGEGRYGACGGVVGAEYTVLDVHADCIDIDLNPPAGGRGCTSDRFELVAPVPSTKPDPSLVPAAGILAIADLLTAAQAKYPTPKWPTLTVAQHVSAALRHAFSHLVGDTIDPEFKRPHLVHAAARLVMAVAVGGKT